MEIMNPTYTGFDVSAISLSKPKLQNAVQSLSKEKIKETAEDFEAFFMTKMMETMYEGISTDGMFGGGHAEKIYRSMLLNEYGKQMAKTGNIGISQDIMDTILQMQEAQSDATI